MHTSAFPGCKISGFSLKNGGQTQIIYRFSVMDNYVCSYCVHSRLIYFLFSISTGPEDKRKQHSDSLSGSTT